VKPVLWTRSRRLDGAKRPMNRDMLSNWLDDKEVENPYTLATAVWQREWKDEFTVLDDNNIKNADLL
jgi:hypothetical protein